MLNIGKMNSLEVLRSVPMGLILGAPEHEVLLPKRYVPDGTSPGDVLEVFLYTDSEDRPIATTDSPLAQADELSATNTTGKQCVMYECLVSVSYKHCRETVSYVRVSGFGQLQTLPGNSELCKSVWFRSATNTTGKQ